MTGVDGTEVLLIILIGLMVLGPKRLPAIANQIGSWIGQARRMTRVMKRQLEDELNADEYKIRPLDKHVPSDDDTYSPIHGDHSTPSTPNVGGMSAQTNVTASEVSLPDDDDELGITPPPPAAEKVDQTAAVTDDSTEKPGQA